ncbi:MAG: putative baseplate assembly protein [Gemmatimonadota bacterium]
MSLAPPELEARTFDEIVSEARRRIGRYTPEFTLGWNDHNESDPGIVLVQLFAWLAQITQERVNQLPERAYRSLLHLLGLNVQPAVPASADLVIEPVPGTPGGAAVPPGTQVGAPPAKDGSPIVFQTTAALDVITAELKHVLSFDGTAFREVTPLNEPAGTTIQPFGERPEEGAAIYFGFAPASPTAPNPFPGRVSLRAFEPEEVAAPSSIACGDAPQPNRAELSWEYLPGPGKRWQRLTIYEDQTRALEVGGYLILEGPQEIRPTPIWTLAEPRYWLRLRVLAPDYGSRVPTVAFFRFNAVPARQEVTVTDEEIGISTGEPDQVMTLPRRPIVPKTLALEVEDESGSPQPWTEVEMFRDRDAGSDDEQAGREAKVFILDAKQGTVQFGDGHRALIPAAGSAVIARSYRYGGGSAGNVGANQIAAPFDTLAGIKGVSNPRPAIGGRDAESVQRALRRAPQWLRRADRAVTRDDFAAAAERIGGVARAEVISNSHPSYPGVLVPGAVTVYVVQDTAQRNPPTPTETLMRIVCDELNRKRTLTTEVYVRSAEFIRIDIEAELSIDPTRSMSHAEEEARKQIKKYLNPIGSADEDGKQPVGSSRAEDGSERLWRFGQDLYPANLQSQLLSLPDEVGVRAVPVLRIWRNGVLHLTPTESIRIPDNALPYLGEFGVRAKPYVEL